MARTTGDEPEAHVRRYYDANTWKFLLTGSQRAIHRELWGPGVTNRRGAVHHAHALVLDELGPDDRRVLDLGCGVGTAALYLADRMPVDVVGVSISPAQIRLAERYATAGDPRHRGRGAPAEAGGLRLSSCSSWSFIAAAAPNPSGAVSGNFSPPAPDPKSPQNLESSWFL